MNSRQKSSVWTHFKKIPPKKIQCNLCKAELTDCGNTTNLNKHLRTKHPSEATSLQADDSQPNAKQPRLEQTTLKLTKYPKDAARQKMLTEKLIKMIVKDMQPFSIVQDEGFRELLQAMDPRFDVPSRTTLTRHLLKEMYTKQVDVLKQALATAEFIALTTDGWTSRQTMSYLTVTCHYITDEWELKSAVLNTVHLKTDHTAEHLADEIKAICVSWGIKDKIVAVVTDGAPNIIAAVRILGLRQMPCFAHLLNLVVKGALEDTRIAPLRTKVKEIVTYFHHSVKASECLSEIQQEQGNQTKKLLSEVETRWNSTFFMLERYHEEHQAVTRALCYMGKPSLCVEDTDMQHIKSALDILRPFDDITKEFSSDKYVSLSKVLILLQVLRTKLSSQSRTLPLAQKLQENLNRRFPDMENHFPLAAATLLDPRFKKLAFSSEDVIDTITTRITTEMTSITQNQTG